MNKNDYKDQELDLKMRIKFLNKKLREPDHGVEKYEEWQSNLEMVTEELTNLQMKKFKFFLGKWISVYKTDNQLVNVVDCMFVSLEKEDQIEIATKWYHRSIKEKDIRHYQLLAKYVKEENEMLKKRLKDNGKKNGKEVKKQVLQSKLEYRKKEKELKKMKNLAIQQSKENMSRNFEKLLRQHVLELNHYKNKHEEQQKIMAAAENGDVIKLQAELVALRKSKNKILDDLHELQRISQKNSISENNTILKLKEEILLLRGIKL